MSAFLQRIDMLVGGRLRRIIETPHGVWSSTIENRADHGLTGAAAWWQSFLRGSDWSDVGNPSARLNVVDVFSGCGGLSLGFSVAAAAYGLRTSIKAAIDTDTGALALHRQNLGTRSTLCVSATTLVDFHASGEGDGARFAYTPEVLVPELRQLGRVDVLLAGPPCEGHSNLNNHTRRKDPRNHLYLTAVSIGVALRARAIIIENVPHVLNDKRGVVETAKALLASSGYRVSAAVIKGETIGLPQRRARFFLVAVRQPEAAELIELSDVWRALDDCAAPLSWAIGDLLDHTSDSPLDRTSTLAPENQARIDFLFDNDLYDLPPAERPDCHRQGTSYTAVYGRMRWDKPTHTITTGFNTPGQGRYIHPLRRRVITPREAARIQCFPDTFSFQRDSESDVARKDLAKWIGDAVPPMLGYAPSLAVCHALASQAVQCCKSEPQTRKVELLPTGM